MSGLLERIEKLPPKKLALLAMELQNRVDALERARREPIAIVGIGCRFPGGVDGPEAFWRLLREGRDAISEVPKARWDIDALYDPDPDAPGRMSTRFGGFIEGVDQFDPQFFGIAPREAQTMDPQQRLLLEVAWEALEHAGLSPDGLQGSRTGVFVGISGHDYFMDLMSSADPALRDMYLATGGAHSVASGRISYVLGLHGPSLSVDTACSSSLVAVHLACLALRTEGCRTALAGGVNLVLSPDITITLSRARMMAPDGRCKTFDARGDGYVRGEGCGILVLKRLTDALGDGDDVLAMIRGSAVNQDGRSSGLTAPNGVAQEDVIRQALADADLDAARVEYVETHGTGTSLGDPIEVRALGATLGAGRMRSAPLLIGSVKTNVGHLESAAGVAGLIKLVLCLQHGEIAPHLHLREPNPHIPWNELPITVPTDITPWRRGPSPRVGAVSSFGFGGTNAHLVVEEAPVREEREASGPERPLHLLALSARSEESLGALAGRYARRLHEQPDVAIADVCFTAAVGRAQLPYRLALRVSTREPAVETLESVGREESPAGVSKGRAPTSGSPRLAFLYTGQGSQHVGMGRELYETQPTFRRALERCAEVVRGELERPLLEVMFGGGEDLDETQYTQPALFALEWSLSELWRSFGVRPTWVMGHSVGEYVAACVAGAYTVEEGLPLIAARGRLMGALARDGAMVSVVASEGRVEEVLRGYGGEVSIAAVNGPQSLVISGRRAAVERAARDLEQGGAKTKELSVSHAFHSALLEPMLGELERVASQVEYRAAELGVVSNLTGGVLGAGELSGRYWRRHARERVRFKEGMEVLREQGCAVFVEVGPRPVLLGMGRECIGEGAWLPTLRKGRGDWEQLLEAVGELYVRGVDVDWSGFDRDYTRRKVALPTYPFQRQRYWLEAASGTRRSRAHTDSGTLVQSSSTSLYEVIWQPQCLSGSTAAGTAVGSWLLIADNSGIAERLRQELEAKGGQCRLVSSADLDRRRLAELLATAEGQPPWRGVVHMESLGLRSWDDADGRALVDATSQLCESTLQVVSTLGPDRSGALPRLWLVTRNAQSADAQPRSLDVSQAPLWGLGRSIALERPELRCTQVDLDTSPAAEDVSLLLQEIIADDPETQVAYRGGVRRVARLVPSAPSAERRGPLVREDATYLVTGGMTGLGLRAARWLAARGARHLVLMGRRAPSADTLAAVTEMEGSGTRVVVAQGDVSSEEDTRRVLTEIARSEWPLRGVIHSAGTTDDAVLANLDRERLRRVLAPKVAGSWNLHRLSSSESLDFFVLFSSMAAVLGSGGQGNYAAANAFLDALAHHRSALGLPALSINWGAWAQVGIAADRQLSERLSVQGIRAMLPDEGLAALGQAMALPRAQVAIASIHWRNASNQRPQLRRFLELVAGDNGPGEPPDGAPDEASAGTGFLELVGRTPPSQRQRLIEERVREQVVRVMRLETSHRIESERPLQELGLDSLMALELRNALGHVVGRTLPPTLLFEHPTIERLVGYLAQEVLAVDLATRAAAADAGPTSSLDGLTVKQMAELLEQRLDAIEPRGTR